MLHTKYNIYATNLNSQFQSILIFNCAFFDSIIPLFIYLFTALNTDCTVQCAQDVQ